MTIDVYYPIVHYNSSRGYIMRKKFMEKYNLDIHNPMLPFNNAYCFPFEYRGKDTTLLDRRHYLFSNETFCESECLLKNINYTTDRAHCLCKIKTQFNQIHFYKQLLPPFPVKIGKTNIIISKCFFLLSIWDNIANNIGFWLICVLAIAQVIVFFVFFFKGIVELLPILYHHMQKVKKQLHIQIREHLHNSKSIIIEDRNLYDIIKSLKEKNTNDQLVSRNFNPALIQSISFNKAINFDQNNNMYLMFIELVKQKSLFIRAFCSNLKF